MTSLARIIATGFGLGYFPYTARATVASLPFLICIPWFLGSSFLLQTGIALALFFFGVLVAGVTEKQFGVKDDGRIVIDEIASLFVTFIGLGMLSWWLIALGFVFNRAFDVWKPWPIRSLQNLGGGWGIMLDDVLAALCANVCLHIVLFII